MKLQKLNVRNFKDGKKSFRYNLFVFWDEQFPLVETSKLLRGKVLRKNCFGVRSISQCLYMDVDVSTSRHINEMKEVASQAWAHLLLRTSKL